MKTSNVIKCLAALAQNTRLAIYRLLVENGPGGLAVGAIAARLDLANATLSFHLKEMTNADLIVGTQQGRSIIYAANFKTMNSLLGYLTENCCGGNPCSTSSVSCDPQREQQSRALRTAKKVVAIDS